MLESINSKEEIRYQKRVSVVKAIQAGEPPKLVARVFQLPLATVYSWLSMYRAGGLHNLRDGQRINPCKSFQNLKTNSRHGGQPSQ